MAGKPLSGASGCWCIQNVIVVCCGHASMFTGIHYGNDLLVCHNVPVMTWYVMCTLPVLVETAKDRRWRVMASAEILLIGHELYFADSTEWGVNWIFCDQCIHDVWSVHQHTTGTIFLELAFRSPFPLSKNSQSMLMDIPKKISIPYSYCDEYECSQHSFCRSNWFLQRIVSKEWNTSALKWYAFEGNASLMSFLLAQMKGACTPWAGPVMILELIGSYLLTLSWWCTLPMCIPHLSRPPLEIRHSHKATALFPKLNFSSRHQWTISLLLVHGNESVPSHNCTIYTILCRLI